MEYIVETSILPNKVDKDTFLNFVNNNNVTATGNLTLLTEDNFTAFTKLGTLCGWSILDNKCSDGIKMVGSLLVVMVATNLVKSAYSTYLCLDKAHRNKKLARFIKNKTLSLANRLGVDNTYYLAHEKRENGIPINSWYRPLNVGVMKKANFDLSTKLVKYRIKENKDIALTEGISSIGGILYDFCWQPDEGELKRFNEALPCYTITYKGNKIGIFVLFPLTCITDGVKINMAMLTYFHSYTETAIAFKALLLLCKAKGFDAVYGYTLGQVNKELVERSGGHITTAGYYFNYYNGQAFSLDKINVPLF